MSDTEQLQQDLEITQSLLGQAVREQQKLLNYIRQLQAAHSKLSLEADAMRKELDAKKAPDEPEPTKPN